MTDGCGPNSFTTGKGDPFFDACLAHDDAYVARKQLKEVADEAFYAAMWERVRREPRWYRRIVLSARAATYEGIVRAAGWLWWRYL
jgi:hypothetical protein